MKRRLVSALLSLFCLVPAVAAASPWIQPQGQLVGQLGYVYQSSIRQYNVDRTLEPYPLQGNQISQDAILQLRYGLADRVEIEAGVAYKILRYNSDLGCLNASALTVHSCPTLTDAGTYPGGADEELKVIDVNADIQGFSDAYAMFKVGLVQNLWRVTVAPYVKVPTGYQPPGALFASPNDDVALGDGQTDLGGFLFLGRAIPAAKTFVRVDLGYLHRFGAPGDQLVGRFRVGYSVHPRVLLAMGAQLEQTVTQGDVIGTQGIRLNPDGTPDLREVRSERDNYSVDAAAIVRLSDHTELVLSGLKTVGGRYVGDARGFSLGVVQHFF